MQTLSLLELSDRLDERRGAQMVTIISRTEPDLIGGKKCPVAGRLTKQSRTNGQVNWSYQNAVNNQRLREGKPTETIVVGGPVKHGDGFIQVVQSFVTEERVLPFFSHPRKWGARIRQTAWVRHIPKDTTEKRVYLELRVLNAIQHQYFLDGAPVSDDEVSKYVRPSSKSNLQGTDKEIICRDYRISNIESITFGGDTFALNVTAEDEATQYDRLGN